MLDCLDCGGDSLLLMSYRYLDIFMPFVSIGIGIRLVSCGASKKTDSILNYFRQI